MCPPCCKKREPWHLQQFPERKLGSLEDRKQGLTTHLSVRPAAASFIRWLDARRDKLELEKPGLRILELGAGTGWFGLNLAANLREAAPLVLTDHGEALSEIYENRERFHADGIACDVSIEAMDWGDWLAPAQSSAKLPGNEPFDLILGTDLVWNSENAAILPWAIKAVLEDGREHGRNTSMLYGHWNRSAKWAPLLMDACSKAGIDITLVTDLEADQPSEEDASAELEKPSSSESTCTGGDSESDSDVDWTAEIFNEEWVISPDPIFMVYSITL